MVHTDETAHFDAGSPPPPRAGWEDRERFFALSLDLLCIAGTDGRFREVNAAWERTLGYAVEELTSRPFLDFVHPDDHEATARAVAVLATGDDLFSFRNRYRRKDGAYLLFEWRGCIAPERDLIYALARDVTEAERAEAERRVAHERMRQQAAALLELSTPLIPITDEVLVMPLIGVVDSRRAAQVLDTLLQGIADRQARAAILDITGVAVVDTKVADALIRTARAVELLGAEVVLTGIRPDVAQTLVALGADLGGLVTRGTLQAGIRYALRRRAADAAGPGPRARG